MKHHLLTTIAAVALVGCGKPSNPEADRALLDAAGAFSDIAVINLAGVQAALDNGADVNAKDNLGGTPLHYAAAYGHKEVAELLIAEGADVNAETNFEDTPLDFAIRYKYPETADLLRKHGGKTGAELKGGESVAEASQPEPPTGKAPDISIHEAANEGNIEAVKQRIADGVDVNAKAEYGRTPLHWAAWVGHKEIVELLITAGADVNAKGVGGITPLDSAINLNRTEIIDLLRKHGGKTGEELKAEGK